MSQYHVATPSAYLLPHSHTLSTLHPSLLVFLQSLQKGPWSHYAPILPFKIFPIRDFAPISNSSGFSIPFIFLLTDLLPLA